MKKLIYLLLTLTILFITITWSYYCASWGFEGAIELAIKNRVIEYRGKIYYVKDTGDTYEIYKGNN